MGSPLLRVSGLSIAVRRAEGLVPLVSDVDLQVQRGRTVGIVGESGSGKSMTVRAILGILPASMVVTHGTVCLDGETLSIGDRRSMRGIRGRRIAMVFQEPASALNPVLTIGEQLDQLIRTHVGGSRTDRRRRAAELLSAVEISDPARRLRGYAHELSGGMRQRVCIALALACEPDILIADEPTTALDVTLQAQVLALLDDLVRARGIGMVLITHSLAVVAQVAQTVMVMYGGRIMESGSVETVLNEPKHPYTVALIAAQPSLDTPRTDRLAEIPGSVPRLTSLVAGCPFHSRCPVAVEACRVRRPELIKSAGRAVACLLADAPAPDEPEERRDYH